MTFSNPLLPRGADPWIRWHDGYFYFCVSGGDHIEMRRAPTLGELSQAEALIVWQDETPDRCRAMWAPEFHLLDGPNGRRWYLYICAGPDAERAPDALSHRLYVLESQSNTPFGPYEMKSELDVTAGGHFWAIDGSVLELGDGRLFLMWAGAPGHRLFIVPLENPWTVCGPRVNLEASGWGDKWVREGPVTLRRDGRVFLFYSACDAQGADYKIGLLWAREDDDLLDPRSWVQHPEPAFTRLDARGVWGPGHNGFFDSPDGSETWIVYHAKTGPQHTFSNRVPCAQKITWTRDGWPLLGQPVGFGSEIEEPAGAGLLEASGAR